MFDRLELMEESDDQLDGLSVVSAGDEASD
jgi:hypothetical protein